MGTVRRQTHDALPASTPPAGRRWPSGVVTSGWTGARPCKKAVREPSPQGCIPVQAERAAPSPNVPEEAMQRSIVQDKSYRMTPSEGRAEIQYLV